MTSYQKRKQEEKTAKQREYWRKRYERLGGDPRVLERRLKRIEDSEKAYQAAIIAIKNRI